MGAITEAGLRERFERFAADLRAGGARLPAAVSRGEPGAPPERSQLGPLAESSPATVEEVRAVLSKAASLLDRSQWASVVIECEGPGTAEELREELAAAGAELVEDKERDRGLRALGMMAVRVPPFPGVLKWLGERRGIRALGDGDRKLKMLRSGGRGASRPTQPWRAVELAMEGGDVALGDDPGRDIVVAVIDSGADAEHPGLEGRVLRQFDLSVGKLGAANPSGHGTHVAGIVSGAFEEGGLSFRGVAPGSRILDFGVFDGAHTNARTLCEAIGLAVEEGADVVNLSVGGDEAHADGTAMECRAIARAVARGVAVCVAAGNEEYEDEEPAGRTITVPGDARDAITVAATDLEGRRAGFSSTGPTQAPEVTGPKPTLAAPGVAILSLRSRYCAEPAEDAGERLTAMDGTSMATPVISGLCAIGLAALRRDGLDAGPEEVALALAASANDRFAEGPNLLGAGVPRLPLFLDELAARSRAGRRRMRLVVPVAVPEGAGALLAAASVPESPQPARGTEVRMASQPKDTGGAAGSDLARRAEEERAFLDGVRGNLARFGAGLVEEVTGRRVGRVAVTVAREDDESQRVADLATRAGAPPGRGVPLPADREVVIDISRRGWFWRGPVLLRVVLKSFAGRQAFDPASRAMGWSPASEYLERLARTLPPGGPPVVAALLAPDGWSESARGTPAAGAFARVALVSRRPGGGLPWFDVAGAEYGWYTWLALTPMDMEGRRERCLATLLDEPRLVVPGGVASVGDIASGLGLPATISAKLVEATVALEARRFRLGGPAEDPLVERASMI